MELATRRDTLKTAAAFFFKEIVEITENNNRTKNSSLCVAFAVTA